MTVSGPYCKALIMISQYRVTLYFTASLLDVLTIIKLTINQTLQLLIIITQCYTNNDTLK